MIAKDTATIVSDTLDEVGFDEFGERTIAAVAGALSQAVFAALLKANIDTRGPLSGESPRDR